MSVVVGNALKPAPGWLARHEQPVCVGGAPLWIKRKKHATASALRGDAREADRAAGRIVGIGFVTGLYLVFVRPKRALLGTLRRSRPDGGAQKPANSCIDKQGRWRWLLLLAVTLCSGVNAFLCMTFSAVEHMSAETFSISTMQVAGLYTIWLITTFVGLTPGTYMTDRDETMSVLWSAAMNMASAGVRVVGAQQRHYGLIVLSQILCGMGAWPIFTLPGHVSHRHFPKQQQALATSVMLQANYLGWLLGVLAPPLLLTKTSILADLFAKQAKITTACSIGAMIMGFLSLRRVSDSKTISASKARAQAQEASGFAQLFQGVTKYPRFAVQVVAHGTLGGISFAAPSAIFFILDNYGFSASAASAVNVAFIGCGTLLGVLLGAFCKHPLSFGKALQLCYGVTAVTLTACAALAHAGLLTGGSVWNFILLLSLCAASGASSLGFIGIAVEAASLYPVKSSFVSWAIEMIVLGTASVLSYIAAGSSGFAILALAAAVCKFAHYLTYQRRFFPEQDVNGIPATPMQKSPGSV